MTDFDKWYREAVDWFTEVDAHIFIHASTLLGAVRNDMLLQRYSFDKELNFGIRAEDLSLQILHKMKKRFPYFLPVGEYIDNSLIFFGPEPIEKYLTNRQDHWQMKPGFGLLGVY